MDVDVDLVGRLLLSLLLLLARCAFQWSATSGQQASTRFCCCSASSNAIVASYNRNERGLHGVKHSFPPCTTLVLHRPHLCKFIGECFMLLLGYWHQCPRTCTRPVLDHIFINEIGFNKVVATPTYTPSKGSTYRYAGRIEVGLENIHPSRRTATALPASNARRGR